MLARPRLSLAAMALVASGCGPSHRMVHQSNVQFERCHSAELAEDVDTRVPYECWDRWIRRYAEGQPAHRVAYARRRMIALAQGETMARLPDGTPVAAASDPGETATDATPPTRATTAAPEAAPIPETAPVPEEPAAAAGAAPGSLAAPASAPMARGQEATPARPSGYRGDPTCQPVCGPPWQRCIAHCPDGRTACVNACENEYRACMGGCF